MNAAERRAAGVVALIAMIRMFGLFALLPVLSLYAKDLQGSTSLLIGLAVGAYGLTQAILQVLEVQCHHPLSVYESAVCVIGHLAFLYSSLVGAPGVTHR